ncbi:MAG: LuxR C-terminal-related transcriptional regulator, partial [Bacteroidota bacterium]
GLLAPDDAPQHLVAALRAVLGGTGYLPPALAHAMAVSGPANRVLSERERQTVMLYGRGLTRAEIAAEMHVTGGTVTTYRGRALKKLGLTTTTDLARYAIQQGWVRLDP